MGPWQFALWLLLLPLWCSNAEQGYIVLSPAILVPESSTQMKLTLFDIDGNGDVLVSLAQVERSYSSTDANNVTIIVEKDIQIEEERDVSFHLDIPSIKEFPNYYYEYFLQVNGSFPNFDFSKEVRVQIRDYSFVALVQTDKPLYRPGQLVQFRLLTIDKDLRPLSGAMGNVRIEDPSGTRMANWLNETFVKGISQYSFQLIDEPTLGNWRIVADINGKTFTAYFEVKEYVLPKFELTITPPPYVLVSDREVTWKICGMYTYGKPVEGTLRINASYLSYGYYGQDFVVPTVHSEVGVKDCYNYTLDLADLEEQDRNLTVRYYYSTSNLVLKVELEEKGTGNVQTAESTVYRGLNVDVALSFEDSPEYFKPGFPIYLKLKVTRPDNSPAPNIPLQLCYTTQHDRSYLCWKAESFYMACRNYTSDSEGWVKFGVPMQAQDVTAVTIVANYTDPDGPPTAGADASVVATLTLRNWYSPSNSFIQIQPVARELPCGEKNNFSVLFTGDMSDVTVYYQLVSKGKLVVQDKMEVCTYCTIDMDPDDSFIYAPSSGEDLESGIDQEQLQFLMNLDAIFPVPTLESRLHYATVTFSPTFDLAPKAFLLVYFVRSDGEVVADSTTITVSKCLRNQAEFKFSTSKDYPGSPISYELSTEPESWCGVTAVDQSLYLLSTANKLDISKVYDYLSQLTEPSYISQKTYRTCPPQPRCNAKYYLAGKPRSSSRSRRSVIEPEPYPYVSTSSGYWDSIEAFERTDVIIITNLNVEPRPCENIQYGFPVPIGPRVMGGALRKQGLEVMASDGSGRADDRSTQAVSVVSVRNNFPETWLFDLVYVGEGKVTKYSELPHTLTTWEGNAVCIHPEKGIAISPSSNVTGFQPFFVSFNMPYSVIRGEKVPLVVSIANYLDTCLPIEVSLEKANEEDYDLEGSPTFTLCLCANEVETHTFYITPKIIGSLNMTVRGTTAPDPSVCEGKDYSTQPARDAESKPLLVEPEGIPQETTLSALVCPKADEASVTPFNISLPEDSNLVPDSVRVYLSVSGDLLGSALRNLDRLVMKAVGCGEQTLVKYLPNILLLRYLEATGQEDQDLKNEALNNIRAGYQRISAFKRFDGSYSPFGNSDSEGSMQLTAQVVLANYEASRYIDVDLQDLERSREWIIRNQDPIDHCFFPVGFATNYYLRSIRTTSTALVLSSLLESGYLDDKVVSGAIECLEMNSTSPLYNLAITTYAFSLAGREDYARQYLALLEDKAFTENGYKYWLPAAEFSQGEPRDLTMDESSIEVAGYVVMAMIQLDGRKGISDVLPIIRGLVSKMNINGGFFSTQDTIVALRALSKYSALLTPEDLARDLDITFHPGSQSFHVDDSNRLVQQLTKMEDTNTDLEAEADGKGCGLIQVQARYNVYNPPESNAFALTYSVTEGRRKCQLVVTICYNYLLDGLSNMVIMEVKMVTGFDPLPITLDQLKDQGQIKKYEYKNQMITFYFDGMSRGEKCLEFLITRTLPVEDVKPGFIKISDYYKEERSTGIKYQVREVSCD